MVSKSVPDGQTRSPQTEEDCESIREQLGRVLSSSVFNKSKGCSNLLAYVVTRTLEGAAETLKERTIGVEVFGRTPDYDTASDHVVRSVASEVRKRLAQYYMEPGRLREIRIDIPPGSYLPRFVAAPVSPPQETEDIGIASVSVPERSWIAGFLGGRLRSRTVAIPMAIAVVLSILAIGAEIRHSDGRTLNEFWQPVLQATNPVLVCIAARNQTAQLSLPGAPGLSDNQTVPAVAGGTIHDSDTVYLDDALALAKLTGWLQQKAKLSRVVLPARVTFTDLQTSPAILIGFNNYWTTSLNSRLRFAMEHGNTPDTRILRDKKNPGRNWSIDLSTPYDQPITDYALVVRALDPETGQMVITAAGLTHFGTLAASDFLTNPAQMKKLDAYAPRGWERKNLAVVLSTDVVKGSPGSPKIVAADFW